MRLRRRILNQIALSCYVSLIEPKKIEKALKDEFWISAMYDELNQIIWNNVWYLVPRPTKRNVIGTKWIFKNKSKENGMIVQKKARLVAQGYAQVEGIDFDKTFAPVVRLDQLECS